jgi:hypothetical protein
MVKKYFKKFTAAKSVFIKLLPLGMSPALERAHPAVQNMIFFCGGVNFLALPDPILSSSGFITLVPINLFVEFN